MATANRISLQQIRRPTAFLSISIRHFGRRVLWHGPGNGVINSPMWNVTPCIDLYGALPVTGQFTSAERCHCVITASGAGAGTAVGVIGMNVLLDGSLVDTCQVYASQTGVHRMSFQKRSSDGLGGAHTITLQPGQKCRDRLCR